MKNTIMLAMLVSVLVIASITAVSAVQPDCSSYGYDRTKEGGVGNIDEECRAAGFEYGIARWEPGSGILNLKDGYTITVSGDDSSASWTSVPPADGILSKEGKCYQDLSGGASGDVESLHFGISHITFCGNVPPVVPEFSAMAGILTALAAVGTFFIVRRK